MTEQTNPAFTSQWWTGTGTTIFAGAYGGLHSFVQTTIGNVPQARIAKTALQMNSALVQGSLGAASRAYKSRNTCTFFAPSSSLVIANVDC